MAKDLREIDAKSLLNEGVHIKVDEALKDIVENVNDLNTKAKSPRNITITLSLAPTDEQRDTLVISRNVKHSLASVEIAPEKAHIMPDGKLVAPNRMVQTEIPDGNLKQFPKKEGTNGN